MRSWNRISGKESFDIKLKDYDDFKLYLFAPIVDGKAVIGLKEKYMSVATFEKLSNGEIKAFDNGEIFVYDENELSDIN